MVTVVIIGYGNRAAKYAGWMLRHPELVRVVAVAEPDKAKLASAGRDLGLGEDSLCADAGTLLGSRRADAAVIATPDRMHFSQAMAAIRAGYDVFVEKPVALTGEECLSLLGEARSKGVFVSTGFVLRYHPYYLRLRSVIMSGRIGAVQSARHRIDIGRDRMTHTFVRGPWGREEVTSPIFVQKCSHDVDLLLWLTGAVPESVSSEGALDFFREENAPEGSSGRCACCKLEPSCPYSSFDLYVRRDRWNRSFTLLPGEDRRAASERNAADGPYSRCVFRCDNNVCDHQRATIKCARGVTLDIEMEGRSRDSGRRTFLTGTKGEIDADGRTIVIRRAGAPEEVLDLSGYVDAPYHAFSDFEVMADFVRRAAGGDRGLGSFESSIGSHLVCFLAEQSRISGTPLSL